MTEDDARRAFREAWEGWRATDDPEEMLRFEKIMDGCQSSIARGPSDPRWKEFAASLPGYLEFWASFEKWGNRAVELMRERLKRGDDDEKDRLH